MRRGVPWVVSLVTCALLAGSVYAAERVGVPPPDRGAAARFVPADGAVAYERVEPAGRPPSTQVVESARGPGLPMVQGLTFVFGALILQSLGEDREEARAWRTTATTVTATADRLAQPGTVFYRVDGAVERYGESTPGRGRAYRPALVELPADVAPGASWSGDGIVLTGVLADTQLSYRSRFRAEAAPDGCLRVVGEIAYADAAGAALPTEQHRKLWCPGRGLVEQSLQVGTQTTTTAPAAPPAPPDRPTVRSPIRWSDPARWTARTFQTTSVDPNFGEYAAMAGSPTLVPPVITGSNDFFRVVQQTGDVLRVTPYTADTWRTAARLHPGGSVLTVATFGELVVVTTSRRQAVGYTSDGIRLWTLDLPEIVTIAADRASPTEALLCDLAGGLRRIDLWTGAVRWTRDIGYGVDLSPVVGGDQVIVTDAGGRQTAYALADGTERWRTERATGGTVIAGPVLVGHARDALEAVDPADGSVRWRRVAVGSLNQLAAAGDRVVAATDRGTYIVGPDGREIARLPSYREVTTTDAYVVGWARTRGEVWSLDGVRLGEWAPPGLDLAENSQASAGPEGVRVAYITWQLDVWGVDGG